MLPNPRVTLGKVFGRIRERSGTPAPRLSAPMSPNHSPERAVPIFIIGCQRSGTSLLRRIIDSHPHIACPPESKFIGSIVTLLRDAASLKGLDSMGFGREEVVRATAEFVRSFFDAYASAQGKPRWADKTPNYVDCLDELWELFGPAARFLIIVRDGMDVAYSLSRHHYPPVDRFLEAAGGNRAVASGKFWAHQNELIRSFAARHADACHELRYEELTGDPVGTLKQLFAFLEEPWEPAVLDYNRVEHHGGYEDPEVRRLPRIMNNSGNHRAWPRRTREAVREACQPALSKLGYG